MSATYVCPTNTKLRKHRVEELHDWAFGRGVVATAEILKEFEGKGFSKRVIEDRLGEAVRLGLLSKPAKGKYESTSKPDDPQIRTRYSECTSADAASQTTELERKVY